MTTQDAVARLHRQNEALKGELAGLRQRLTAYERGTITPPHRAGDAQEFVNTEIEKPGYSLIRCWLVLHGGTSAKIVREELAQLVTAYQSAHRGTAPHPHSPPAVHHLCRPSNLVGAPNFPVWCRHTRTLVDGAAQQDDYECENCGAKIVVNISEWAVEAGQLSASQSHTEDKE